MPRLISTRSVVTSLPSTTTPGVTYIFRPQSVMSLYAKLQYSGSWKEPQQREQDAAVADLLVSGQRLVEEVEEVVVHRHDLLHELDVAHQPGDVVGHQLDRGHRAHAARVERGRVDVPALHQAEHLPGPAADLQGLAVELAGERVQRPHDVADGAVAVGRRSAGPRCCWPSRAHPGWSRRPSSRSSPPRPGSPGRCCGRTCTPRPRRG